MAACVVAILIPLLSLLYTAIERGGRVLSVSFLTSPEALPCSPINCSTGGILPALQGTFVLLGLASLIAVPAGLFCAIYLAEFGRGRFSRAVSFFTDVMTGLPSIIMGVFVYSLFLVFDPTIVFSAITGSLALAVLMLPIIVRTSEEALRLVPTTVREAAMALGIPKYRSTFSVVLSAARNAVITGILLSVMRAGGEAAPLLFTAFGNRQGFVGFNQPVEALGPYIYNSGFLEPYSNLNADAWGAALVLILIMLGLSVITRRAFSRSLGEGRA